MYNMGKISDLIYIDKYEVESFIKSYLDEIGYFNCSIGNLVSLKEYLIELKVKKEEYDRLISGPLKSIKEKNLWCTDIQPANGEDFCMEAKAKNHPSINISSDIRNFSSSLISQDNIPLLNHLYSKRFEERSLIGYNSKFELLEIQRIIKSFGFSNDGRGLITASERFIVIPYNFEEVHIKRKRLGYYYIIKMDSKGNFIFNDCGLTCFNSKDSKKYADSFIKKLYLTKK